MITYTYNTTDYYELMLGLGKVINAKVENNCLIFPDTFADGFFNYFKLPNGLQANIFDIQLKQPFTLFRSANEEEYYTLRFDEFTIPQSLQMQMGSTKVNEMNAIKSIAYLTSSLSDFKLVGLPGMKFRGVNILFSEEWIAHYLKLADSSIVLEAYFNLKAKELNLENITAEDKILLNEIFYYDPQSPLKTMAIQNRLLLLIEHFFSRLYKKSQGEYQKFKVRKEDVIAVNEVQRQVSEKFGREGPTIEALSKLVSISPTKLKTIFKNINGIAIYEYSQVQRMAKAKQLVDKGMSMKDVAEAVGYDKLANFMTAYRKAYP